MDDLEQNPNIYTLGEGVAIMTHGIVDGCPALFMCRAVVPGVPGERSDQIPGATWAREAVVIRFTSADAVARFLGEVDDMVNYFAKEAYGQEADPAP